MIALLLLACGPKVPVEPAPTATATEAAAPDAEPGYLRYVKPASTVTYLRAGHLAGFDLPHEPQRENWSAAEAGDGRTVYQVVTEDRTGGRWRVVEEARLSFSAEGLAYLGTWKNDEFVAWDPPQIVLPPNPKVGDTWSAIHKKGDKTSDRSCEILASDRCEGGLVSVCDSKREASRVVLRDHFCPDAGWAGFEMLRTGGEQPALRMWTENIVRDGVPVGPQIKATLPPAEGAPADVPGQEGAPIKQEPQ